MVGAGLFGEKLEVISSGRLICWRSDGGEERRHRASRGISKGRSQGTSHGPQRGSGASLLDLVGVVASAFDRVQPRGPLGRLARRVDTLIALLGYERRVHESGRALCLVGLRWGRVVATTAILVVVAAIASALSEAAAATVVVITVFTFLPLGLVAAWSLPSRARLSGQTPRGHHRYVHSLASTKRGAGADVLRALCVEADVKHWSLVLDAGSEQLVGYYEAFGFRRCGSGVRMPSGRVHVRMVRPSGLRLGRGGQESAWPGGE